MESLPQPDGSEQANPRSQVSKTAADHQYPPQVFVNKVVMDKGCPYDATARWIAVVIAARMDAQGIAFMSSDDIADRTGFNERTIQIRGRVLWDGPRPLFKRTFPGETKGIAHRCPRFELIRFPRGFAAARERKREERRGVVAAILSLPGSKSTPATETAREELARARLEVQQHELRGERPPEILSRRVQKLEAAALRLVGGSRNDPRKGGHRESDGREGDLRSP